MPDNQQNPPPEGKPENYVPDEFDEGLTMAGVDVGNIPPPPSATTQEATGAGYIPDEYDDGRTIAGAQLSAPPPPPGSPGATGSQPGTRAVDSATANFFLRLRRTDQGGEAKTYTGVEVITVGQGDDQVMRIDHDLLADSHARIVYRDDCFELSALGENEILVNGKKLEGTRILCREDEILFVGEGGPSLIVDMMYPNRDPEKKTELTGSLSALGGFVNPLAEKWGVDPLLVIFGAIYLACTGSILSGYLAYTIAVLRTPTGIPG